MCSVCSASGFQGVLKVLAQSSNKEKSTHIGFRIQNRTCSRAASLWNRKGLALRIYRFFYF